MIDGFNLYHSTDSARKHANGSTKWLDMRSFCASYLEEFGTDARLQSVHWFTAIAYYMNDSEKIRRHRRYKRCLEDSGVEVHEAEFKKKDVFSKELGKYIKVREEKQTDVHLASKLLEIFVKDSADHAVMVTGDTDQVPAVETARRLFGGKGKQVSFLFPSGKPNNELKDLVPWSVSVKAKRYVAHQFPDPYRLKNGKKIAKPSSW